MITKLKAGFAAIALAGALAATAAMAGDLQTLRGTGVTEMDQAPAIHSVDESGNVARAYRQQPPLVPHKIDKYQVDLKANQCLRCHEWPYSDQMKAPKASETHYVDRNGVRTDKVSAGRWFCTQCHVPQADAKPLVDNTFQAAE